MNSLFKPIASACSELPWFSWNDDVREMLHEHAQEFSSIRTHIVNLDSDKKYNMSYTIMSNQKLSTAVGKTIKEISHRLKLLNPDNGIILLKDLMDEKFNITSIHVLFSLIAKEIRQNSKDNLGAFHSPIVEKISDNGFPVHSDLFKIKGLLNVITSSKKDSGGDILLISSSKLIDIMTSIQMPKAVIALISQALVAKPAYDLFDMVYSLMYGNHEWSEELSQKIISRQQTIPSEAGVGYFIIDGQWLHGRTAVKGQVQESRLQRLVFDTHFTEKLPVSKPINFDHFSFNHEPQLKSQTISAEFKSYTENHALPNKALQA